MICYIFSEIAVNNINLNRLSQSQMAYSGSKKVVNEDVHDGTDSTEGPSAEHNIEALHYGTELGKKQFLGTFTAEEDKAIMRKVDMRFLWLIGITYLIKNSKAHPISPPNNAK